jgi:hypothetical protein
MPISRGHWFRRQTTQYPLPPWPHLSAGPRRPDSLVSVWPSSSLRLPRAAHGTPAAPSHTARPRAPAHASVSLHSAAFFQPPPTRIPTPPPRGPPLTLPSSPASYGVLGGAGRRGDRSPVPPPRTILDLGAQPPCGVPSASTPQSQVTSRLL